MARIRSIKPDFFTSETISALPVSARLTFIGLWTHVDDNGVCPLNELLIAAALYPLDGPAGLDRTREDLRSLSGESLVALYQRAGKRYLYVTSWDEHQKVSHPRKPRFPRPDEEGCSPLTSSDVNPPEDIRRGSGEPPEPLRPEQGAGSREQGEKRSPKRAPRREFSSADADGLFEKFWSVVPRRIGKKAARRRWDSAIKEADPETIIAAMARYADSVGNHEPKFIAHPETWLNQGRWDDEINYQPPAAAAGGWWDN